MYGITTGGFEYYLLAMVMFWLATIGVFVILFGLFRPSEEVDPHCRSCKYSLVGNPNAESCPECGASLAGEGAVVRREAIWRPDVVAAGIAIVLAAAI